MSWWTAIVSGAKAALGIGGAAVAGASGNPLATATAVAGAVSEVSKATREGGRAATERAIKNEKDANDTAIDAAVEKGGAVVLLLGGLLLAFCSGCASAPSRDFVPTTGNVGRLLGRPDFDPAVQAAPEWVRDSLKTVNSLEADLQRERAQSNQVR